MKASLQWMNEYVPVDMNRPAQELADELTQAGIPVEDVIAMDNGIKKIYTGKIVEITKTSRCQINYKYVKLNALLKKVSLLQNKS